ncbi:Piwi domain-containing protein [Marinifilum sp. RC60d5]|uniref:Piwi domain-containing protein n=1 Tax=Marinifilum sp. RC60d5 TaxID=3458414 RepID=UPI004036204E
MQEQNLFFNTLTFDFPSEKQTFYFSKDDIGEGHKIYKSLFPDNIDSIFPGLSNSDTEAIFTTFTGKVDKFLPLSIDLEKENPDLIKRYYNRQINYYFSKVIDQIVKVGFIKENQVWVHDPRQSTSEFKIYKKFSLKVQLKTLSKYPELLVSYDGISKVLKKSVAEIIQGISPTCLNWVVHNNKLEKWAWQNSEDNPDYNTYFPVLNKKLQSALNLPPKTPDRGNRYPKYLSNIQDFYNQYLDTTDFKKIIPLHDEGFLNVSSARINTTTKESNLLVFGKNQLGQNYTGITPKYDLKKFKPYKASPYKKVHLFFIMHKEAIPQAFALNKIFTSGLKWFKGLQQYANILFHIEKNFSITFIDKENPIPEIEKTLSDRDLNPDVKYIAIYITPYSKYDSNKEHREIYYQVKELLLKRNITSQAIDPDKMIAQGDDWVYSLPNIAVAILAKLDGIPWRLNTPVKNELIIGIGAFKHIEENIQYIGSAFSFSNDGKFNSFEYFMKDEIELLAGKISKSVRDYATINNKPDRLIIHFYKSMSEREIVHIQNALNEMDLSIPVFIISINKTESKDIIAFDKNWSQLMPASGTFINIGRNKYLLFNNTRYPEAKHNSADGYPFPIKLSFDCTDKEQLKDAKVIRQLIDQVYQFSRMYWKSVRQQNLPVTIKYPEMIAKIAPHFVDEDIPVYGKDNLWFL